MLWAVGSEGLGLERFWHPGAEVLLVRGERSLEEVWAYLSCYSFTTCMTGRSFDHTEMQHQRIISRALPTKPQTSLQGAAVQVAVASGRLYHSRTELLVEF